MNTDLNPTAAAPGNEGAKTTYNWLKAAGDIERLASLARIAQTRAAAMGPDATREHAQAADARNTLKSAVLSAGYGLAAAAHDAGLVLVIEQVPMYPWAMGRYSAAVRMWPARA